MNPAFDSDTNTGLVQKCTCSHLSNAGYISITCHCQ